MTLRNVPKAHTLEQQRQEINLIASDLNTAVDGVKTFGGDKTFTGDITFSDSGSASFGDDADLKIYYDNSVGVLTSFIESDALQIRSATDTSELYATFLKDGPVELYYDGTKRFGTNATGATVLGDLNVSSNLTFDTAGSHIEFTPSSYSGSAPYMEFWVGNNSGTHYAQIDGGNAGQLQIMNTGHPNGHLDLRTAKDFSVDCGGYYAILAQATGATKIWHPVSQENILNPKFETTATGAKINGILESSLLVNTNNTPTAGEGIEMFYDSAASGGAAGGIQAFDRDGAALTRLKIRSSNWEIMNDGSGSFGGDVNVGGYDGSSTTADGILLGSVGGVYSQLADGNPTGVLFQGMHGSTFTSRITADGSATFAGGYGSSGVSITSDGEVRADSQITSNRSSGICFSAQQGGTQKASISANGAAAFAGEIKVEGSSTPSGLSSRISKYGSLLIGTSSDAVGDARLSIDSGNGNIISIGSATFSNTVKAQQTSNNALSAFEAVDTNGTRFKVTGAGVLSIYDNTLTEKLTISSDGLTFSGQPNSSVANVTETSSSFDHYEQGTFTPYYGFGLSSASYTFAGGDYIRIGNIVHFYLTISATGTNNGDQVTILGLPYNIAGNDGGSATFAYNTGLVSSNGNMPNIYIAQSNGGISFYETGSGAAWAGNSGSGLSGAQLYIGGHYICA
jgi:hypothetical protein